MNWLRLPTVIVMLSWLALANVRRHRQMASLHGRSIGLRRRFAVRTTVTIAVAVLLGLSTAGWSQGHEIGGKRGIDVATMNLYVGSDFSPVTSLDPGDPNFLAKLLNGVATIHARI